MAKDTKFYYLECPIKWVKVFEEDRDYGTPGTRVDFTERQGRYSVVAVLTEEKKKDMLKFGFLETKLGHQMFKIDKDGDLIHTFHRDHYNPKQDWTKGAPEVFDLTKAEEAAKLNDTSVKQEKVQWDKKVDGLIGNGTVAILKIELYDPEGIALEQLESVAIKELVSYESNDNLDDDVPF